jgi:hypothetical protein
LKQPLAKKLLVIAQFNPHVKIALKNIASPIKRHISEKLTQNLCHFNNRPRACPYPNIRRIFFGKGNMIG